MTTIQKQLENIAEAAASKLGMSISTYPAMWDCLKISTYDDSPLPDEFDDIMRSNGVKYFAGCEWGLVYKFAN